MSSGTTSLEQPLLGEDTCAADNEFQGPASTTAFMTGIRRIIEGRSHTDDVPVRQRIPTLSHAPVNHPDLVLPHRQLADSLLDNYWEFVHPLYPFLHKADFDLIYESLRIGQEPPTTACTIMRVDSATSLCLLNLTFALGCQYHRDTGAKTLDTSAEVFYQRARSLLRVDPIESSNNTLQLVQAMLLMAQLLVSIGHTQKAWGIIGMAVRTCYQLGLHHAATSDAIIFPKLEDRRTVRLVYHGTLMLER